MNNLRAHHYNMLNLKYCKKRKSAEVCEGSKIVWSYWSGPL